VHLALRAPLFVLLAVAGWWFAQGQRHDENVSEEAS
jgi:hypothetical protein